MIDEELHTESQIKKTFKWICGIEALNKRKQMNKGIEPKVDLSIEQDPLIGSLIDVNAVLVMGVCGFCYAFFNRF